MRNDFYFKQYPTLFRAELAHHSCCDDLTELRWVFSFRLHQFCLCRLLDPFFAVAGLPFPFHRQCFPRQMLVSVQIQEIPEKGIDHEVHLELSLLPRFNSTLSLFSRENIK